MVSEGKDMKTLIQTAAELQDFFKKRRWHFCFIGGLALQRWGMPRLTIDIDISLLTGFGGEEKYIEVLIAHFAPRISKAEKFALKNRVLLLKSENGVGIDIAFAGLPFEEKMIKRASEFEFLPEIKLVTCSAEDLIILKSFADRPQDRVDVESIIERQGGHLNRSYIKSYLQVLCDIKGTPEILTRLDTLWGKRK
jgi:hypothetical protein